MIQRRMRVQVYTQYLTPQGSINLELIRLDGRRAQHSVHEWVINVVRQCVRCLSGGGGSAHRIWREGCLVFIARLARKGEIKTK